MRDLDILSIATGTNKASMDVTGHTVSGIRLLAQRIIVILMTNYNDILRSQEGTSFMDNVGSGQVSLSYAGLLMTSAIASTIDALNESADENAPDEERIADLRIQNMSLDGDRITFDLYVENKANESTTISSDT